MVEFAWRRRQTPVILQMERAECGLACIAMVLCHHGFKTDLAALRHDFPFSAMGVSLKELVEVASRFKLSPRALKAPQNALARISLPAILHWEMQHFVVLVSVERDGTLVINDPAVGRRRVPSAEAILAYTGVTLELRPSSGFVKGRLKSEMSFRELLRGAISDFRPVRHGLILAVLSQLFALAVPKLGQFAVDNVVPSGSYANINVLGLGLVFIAACVFIAVLVRGLAFSFLGTMLHGHLARNLYDHLLKLPLAFFQRQHSAELIARVDSLRILQRVLSVTFIETVVDGATAVLAIGLVALDSSALAVVSAICMGLYAVVRTLGQERYAKLSEEQVIRASRVQTEFTDTVRGIETIKVHNAELSRRLSWDNMLVNWFNTNNGLQNQVAFYSAAAQGLTVLNFGLCLWLGVRATMGGQITLGALLAALSLLQLFAIRFCSLVDKLSDFGVLKVHRSRLSDVFSAEAEPDIGHVTSFSVPDEPASLELQGVTFRYMGAADAILSDLSMRVAPGDFVAITGPSGSGKTTLLRTMLGLYEPERGRVLIDGQPLASFGKDRFRTQIGVVLQSDMLFSGSVAENISSFDPMPDQQFILDCAKRAGIHDAIMTMPMRYQTPVGDMGTVLSGGQQQRIFLARALYRRPRLLFLDEATSSLDAKKEREINAEIASLGITRIIFAHRLETIRSASRVLRLNNGSLNELTTEEILAL
jgi:ATP-binding cassette, subfamily B, bacterial CvaB/MchF/RaxB